MDNIQLEPRLLTGALVQVTDLGVVIELKGRMGMLHLPRRSIISDHPMTTGLEVQVWLSYAQILNSKE
ncbi:MAG: CBO2463/CBO2479 domain-containing protein [Solidesulfovibrio sp.]